MDGSQPLTGRRVLIAGASGAAATAVARSLVDAGARVVGAARNRAHLDDFARAVPGVETEVCDLADASAVAALATRIHTAAGPLDGMVHLVGGWRGGGSIPGQSDEDWAALEISLTSLRNASRVFYDDLAASPAGRLAIVSSTSVARPRAGAASYTALKAAAEAWTLAVAQGFEKAASPAAAVVFRVTSLAGLEDRLAAEIAALWNSDAAALNGRVTTLA